MPRSGSLARTSGRLAFHLLTVLAFAVCVLAAWWQWGRAHRTEAEALPKGAEVALADLDPTKSYSGMRVALVGRFDPDREALVAPRERDDRPGAWVLTPLIPNVGADGTIAAVAVLRGWIPEGSRPTPPPTGEVAVTGVLIADERAPGVTPVGDPPTMTVVDTGALSAVAGYPVRSGWFAMQDMRPAGADQPLLLRVTELPGADVGLNWRNAAYAAQWVAFAGFVIFFWLRYRRDEQRQLEQELPR